MLAYIYIKYAYYIFFMHLSVWNVLLLPLSHIFEDGMYRKQRCDEEDNLENSGGIRLGQEVTS